MVDITRHAEALAVLADSRYIPPPVRQDAPEGTLAWLRARASRFSTGQAHAGRRRLLEDLLAALDPDTLRDAARDLTLERDGRWEGVPVTVLGHALGFRDPGLASAARTAAPGYLSGEEKPEADAAVRDLFAGRGTAEDAVARVTLLLQAHDATEGLIRNALREARPGDDVARALERTLRLDPPLTVTRRLDRETGAEVRIDLVRANRDGEPHLTFGAGVRPCPADRHATALATGVLTAVLTR
ncbi:hypothetical protein OUY22_31030 [Nonomuraea sp. MCN248]|uniref:Cytochrome P450 n=1 Tax=Nonomuraea corallina TaxID=2989783 RepID=A0ABT4SLP0_9ACTN|nr:hypothetical protein [Nonomuraea corallina]MDA0637865.1 hypothetical protein [Nonomuraea corallina]